MKILLYLSCYSLITCAFLHSAQSERHAHFKTHLIAAAVSLGRIHSLASHDDFEDLRNVHSGDTIKTPVPEKLLAPGYRITYCLKGNNFIENRSSDKKHVLHTMGPGSVRIVEVFESYNPAHKNPYMRHEKSYVLRIPTHEPTTMAPRKSCIKKDK